jgi:hypothetical protein
LISSPQWLLPAYIANILILVPVCAGMIAGGGVSSVFEGKVAESDGLRLMVASLWLGILVASFAGLRWPAFFAPVVLIQIVYKALWLGLFIMPKLAAGMPVPAGITTVFAAIVLAYPVLLWLSSR